ncbi:MAG: carbamoyltransferase C-terminal domain-containing protein [Alphaproteobacteria bacterium]
MVILGIASEHCSAAALMIDGRVVGMIQEERLSKRKNQVAFPLQAIRRLVARHLGGDFKRIDRVVFGGRESDPYYAALDRFSHFSIADHVREQHELWQPHFYGGKRNDGTYWQKELIAGRHINEGAQFDFSWLTGMTPAEATKRFVEVERPAAVKRHLDFAGPVEAIDHHTCHAYYALHGGPLDPARREEALILTADAWGDGCNWSASTASRDGRLTRVAAGSDLRIARIYKWTTLILGMKPNEHEYKVMGLSAYPRPGKYVAAAERIFFEAFDFRDGKFVSERPLVDSYFDLKNRLEGHRFDNIAGALQNWATAVTSSWVRHWLKETGRRGLCFSGGLSMNIKTNGELLNMPEVAWLSVPASGGDESLCAGACLALAAADGTVQPMAHAYLGEAPDHDDWRARLAETDQATDQFAVRDGIDAKAAARLLATDFVVARCVGEAEFGARALGNRSILANPSNPANVKLINDAIKNRDFWMPFTPSIQAEHAGRYLHNPKDAVSPFMTIGFASKPEHRNEIAGALHFADHSARPQFVDRATNPAYWQLIEEFRKLTGVPALLNTSLNLHGEPMNYSLGDAARTVALSELDFLLMPGDRLLYKKRAAARLDIALKADAAA